MKEKHLKALRDQHERNLNRGSKSKPNISNHVRLALVNGERLKVKPAEELIREAKEKIAKDRYDSGRFDFDEVFTSCPSFEKEMAAWKKANADRQKKVKAYRKVAEKILRKAEFDDAADPAECAEKLQEAADEAGL